MTQTSVKIMQCELVKTGQLKIDCIGVGVGVILHNESKKIGAGVHVLAPHSTTPDPGNPAKFASSAVPHMIDLLEKEGVSAPLAVAIAGGAAMAGSAAASSMGTKIVDAVKEALAKAKLNIKIDETGGSNIRSMLLDLETGEIHVK